MNEMLDAQQLTLDVSQSIEIRTAIGDAYSALITHMTDEHSTPDNKALPMVLEQWPGGRWFRDLGNGQGHLWGFVQVIKPPTLIEIQGPLFMSYAVAGHVEFRLHQVAGGVEFVMRHRAVGMVDEAHRAAVGHGWNRFASGLKQLAEA